MELAATAGQVIPVFALGGLVVYAAQVRNHNQFLRPFLDRTEATVDTLFQLHDQGLRGYELVTSGQWGVRGTR